MSRKIDQEVRLRAVRLVTEHRSEYSSETQVRAQVAESLGVSQESVRRWVTQHQIDTGMIGGVTTEEREEIRRLKSEVARLREINAILRSATIFFARGTRPPQPMIVAFVDQMRASGHAVESIVKALQHAGVKIAARTLRRWCSRDRLVADRIVTDAQVEDAVRSLAFRVNDVGERVLAPEGLYGRRKMLAAVRRGLLPTAGFAAVDRAMRALGLNGVTRTKRVRTTIPNPRDLRPADLLERDFTAPEPHKVWVSDFTYVRTSTTFTYVAFVVDVFSHRIVGWNASIRHDVELVDVPVRMALWDRDRTGRPIERGQLISHSDAGAEYTSIRYTEHLQLEGIRPSIGSVGDAFDCQSVPAASREDEEVLAGVF